MDIFIHSLNTTRKLYKGFLINTLFCCVRFEVFTAVKVKTGRSLVGCDVMNVVPNCRCHIPESHVFSFILLFIFMTKQWLVCKFQDFSSQWVLFFRDMKLCQWVI